MSDGHFDFGPILENGVLRAGVKNDAGTWVDPSSVTFVVGSQAATTVPDAAAFAFLGAPGSDIWLLSQTQQSGLPWLGWNTQHESIRGQVDGSLTWTLNSVDGPGDLIVYLDGALGGAGARVFDTIGGPSSYQIPVGATGVHTHGNWAFTAPGSYRVTTTLSGTIAGEARTVTDSLTFVVGQPPAPDGSGAVAAAPAPQTEATDAATSAPDETSEVVTTSTVVTTVGQDASGQDCDLGSLASTGTSAAPLLPLGLALMLLGGGFLVTGRRNSVRRTV